MNLLRHSVAAVTALGLAPLGAAALALRPSWRPGWRDRLGLVHAGDRGGIWIHAASVGEVLAAVPLVEALMGEGERVHLSAMTEAGLRVACEELAHVSSGFAPLDHPWSVDAALDRIRPELLALVETEIWPSWIAAARSRGIPVVLVSARLSDSSFARYRRLRLAFGRTFRRLSAVGARSQADAERFVALGVPSECVTVTGDLKLEFGRTGCGLAGELARALSAVPIIVAGSTHPGEERAALVALDECAKEGLDAALVLAPRKLSRVEELAAEVRGSGRVARRRSGLCGDVLASGDVLILDTMGELAGVYEVAAAAFLGGTLVPVGGHNLFEPMMAGCPVIFGPHTHDIRAGVELAIESGAGTRVEDAEAMAAALCALLRAPSDRRARGAAGRAALDRARDTTQRSRELILERLHRTRDEGRTGSPKVERSKP